MLIYYTGVGCLFSCYIVGRYGHFMEEDPEIKSEVAYFSVKLTFVLLLIFAWPLGLILESHNLLTRKGE